jgi:hypothetical protein
VLRLLACESHYAVVACSLQLNSQQIVKEPYMKKLRIAMIGSLMTILLSVGIVLADSVETGRAQLQQIDRSGIRAQIIFVDTGTELLVVGTATGMDPDAVYESLIYDNGAQPRGEFPCIPGLDPSIPPLSGLQMFVSFWEPVGSSTHVLTAVKSGLSYVALGEFATMSVRELPTPVPPDNTDLRTCGRVRPLP